MAHVRKEHPGGDSFGHSWAGGDAVEMPEEQARDLVAIDSREFAIVEPGPEPDEDPGPEPDPKPEPEPDPEPPAKPKTATRAPRAKPSAS